MRDRDDVVEPAAFGGVEVEDEMGEAVRAVDRDQRGVVLDRPLVGEPQERAPVVAQRVRHVALRRLGPHRDGADPLRRVLGDVLLHERLLAAVDADHRERAVLQRGEDAIAHRVEVVDEVALGRVGTVEQRLVEVGERDTVTGLVGLGAHPTTVGQTRGRPDSSISAVPC